MYLAGLAAGVVFRAWWGRHSSDGETWRHIDVAVLWKEC